MREIKNTAEVSLTIRLLTFTMYFSSPHLLCLQATKCMMQLHSQIENLKTETGSKEAAATTPKLCALSPKSQPSQGSVKKKTLSGVYLEAHLIYSSSQTLIPRIIVGPGKGCGIQVSTARHSPCYDSSSIRLHAQFIKCSCSSESLSKSKRRSKVACIYEGLNGVNR